MIRGFILSIFLLQSTHGGEAIYYKKGETGIFHVTISVPDGINVSKTVFSIHTDDNKLYGIYISNPYSKAEMFSLMRQTGSRRESLTPEQKARLKDLDKQLRDINKKSREHYENIRAKRQQLKAMETMLKEINPDDESKKPLCTHLEMLIPEFKAKISVLEKQQKEQAEKISLKRRRLYQERNRIYSNRRKQTDEKPRPVPGASQLKIFGRFQSSGRSSFDIFARNSEIFMAEPMKMKTVPLNLPQKNGGDPELLKKWARTRAQEFALRVADSPYSSFYQYCIYQSSSVYDIDTVKVPMRTGRQARGRRDVDMYALTTGALAIQETLQLEEMTGRQRIAEKKTIPIGSLKGPQIKSHPFQDMIKGRAPQVFPSASLIPYDNYYCHFSSIEKLIDATDLMQEWGASLLRSINISARDSDLIEKYQRQLCLNVSDLTRLFGDLAIGEVVLTGNDPFFMEGTDLTAVIRVKNRIIFDTQFASCLSSAMKREPKARKTVQQYNSVSITCVSTPDRMISSCSAYLADYKIISNSLTALRQIIDTSQKKRQSLKKTLCFRYMRTVFPGTPEDEDGFIYMSDPFIRKLLSPKWKIENQRRMACQNHIMMLHNSSAMFRADFRRKPTFRELSEKGYIPAPGAKALKNGKPVTQSMFTCPDGGTYSMGDSGRIRCSVHNCLRYATPIGEVSVDTVTPNESRDYSRFVKRYNRYWSRYFDPVGIRISMGNRIEIETCILPLVENSIYNQFREIIGGKPVDLDSQIFTRNTIFSVGSKLNMEWGLFREFRREIREIAVPGMPPVHTCIGDNISINLYDGDVLFTFDEDGMNLFRGWLGLEEQLMLATIFSGLNLPIYSAVEIKDRDAVKQILRELIAYGRRMPSRAIEIGHYPAGLCEGYGINTFVIRFYMVKFRFFYAITPDHLIVSTKRYVLEDVLAAVKNKTGMKKSASNLNVIIQPAAFNKLRPTIAVGWQERMRKACLNNLVTVRNLIENHGASENTLEKVSRAITGYSLRCPSGGEYIYDPLRDVVYCSRHGSNAHPMQPAKPTGNEKLFRFFQRLKKFSVDFSFTEEGIMTKVMLDLYPDAEEKNGNSLAK